MPLHVLAEGGRVGEFFSTLLASELLLVLNLSVNVEVSTSPKRLAAYITSVRLLADMCALVAVHRRLTGKLPRAKVTSKGLFAAMRSLMPLKIGGCAERFFASATLGRRFVSVQACVLLKSERARE